MHIGFLNMAKRSIWRCPPYIKTLHPPCLLTISTFTKGKSHANWWIFIQTLHGTKRSSDDLQIIYVYIVENEVMLLVNAQRSLVNMQFMPLLLPSHSLKNQKMKMFNLNKDGETKIDLLCDENGHNLSKSNTMNLITIIMKCNNFKVMETQTF